MRLFAVCAILVFVGWVAIDAVRPMPESERSLAPARYVVGVPVAAVADPVPPVGEASTVPVVPTPQPLNNPATAATPATRGIARQVTATEAPPVTYTIPHYDQWVRLAECESGGDWSINTGNGYYGGLQFSLTSWKGAGGLAYAAYPHMAGAAEQMVTAETLLSMQGWSAWPSCSRKVGLR